MRGTSFSLFLSLTWLAGGATELSPSPVYAAVPTVDESAPDPLPQSWSSNYAEAQELLRKRSWPEAAISLRSVVAQNANFLPAALDLARALLFSGRREEAIGVLERALQRDTNAKSKAFLQRRIRVLSSQFLTKTTFQKFHQGVALFLDGKYRQAKDHLEAALAQEPDNAEVLARLGQCLLLLADHDSASEQLRQAARLNPYDPDLSLWLGRALLERGEVEQSLPLLTQAQKDLGQTDQATLWLAEALVADGQRAQAIQLLEKATQTYPTHVRSLLTLARLRYQGALRDARGKSAQTTLWAARRDLQLAMSRWDLYVAAVAAARESSSNSLGFEPVRPTQLKADLDQLMKQVETRLEELSVSAESSG